jgi:demethylmenaquinone methyltransferase / 2-methoxy-6-polyprenyl-1,4-benzoquinol methylase
MAAPHAIDTPMQGQPGQDAETIDFGFQRIPRAEKASRVRAVFDSVAPRYDLMNDLMSAGIHRRWKAALVRALAPRPAARLVDLASGTGDVPLLWRRAGGGPVIATDINEAMLARGRDRLIAAGAGGAIDAAVADAERLPLPDAIADRVSIAFGLRNCTDRPAVLREARRVLRPGGRFFCLEFSRLQVAALLPLYDAWSFRVLPRLGALIAADAESYRYLAESIRTFPDAETLAGMLREAGFDRVGFTRLTGGIAAIHTGWRL